MGTHHLSLEFGYQMSWKEKERRILKFVYTKYISISQIYCP